MQTILWQLYYSKVNLRSNLCKVIPNKVKDEGCMLRSLIETDERILWPYPVEWSMLNVLTR